jgi:hypothetical protein
MDKKNQNDPERAPDRDNPDRPDIDRYANPEEIQDYEYHDSHDRVRYYVHWVLQEPEYQVDYQKRY